MEHYKIDGDLIYEINNGGYILSDKLRYDPDNNIIVDISALPQPYTFYIDNRGTKHIKQLDPNWQTLQCNWDDLLINDNGTWRVITDNDILQQQKENLKNVARTYVSGYVMQFYDYIKQKSDISDTEYWVNWLTTYVIDNSTNTFKYTVDEVRRQSQLYGDEVISGARTLQQILTDIQTNVLPNVSPSNTYNGTSFSNDFLKAWEQLIKVCVRQHFVQECKKIYWQIIADIDNLTTIQDAQNFNIENYTLPQWPNV